MIAAASLLGCGIFGTAMLHAAVTDLRYRRIRNRMVAALALCWAPVALAAGMPPAEMAMAAAAAVLVFAAGLGCFAAGWLGGGDVKLAAAAVLWLGAGQALAFVLLTSVLGAVLTALMLLARRVRAAPGATPLRAGPEPDGPASGGPEPGGHGAPAPIVPEPRQTAGSADPGAGDAGRRQVPYGPALAAAGLALLHGSHWAAVL